MSTLHLATRLHAHAEWLGRRELSLADESLSAHEDQDYPVAVVRAGTCLEGLASSVIARLQLTPEGQPPTLGQLIGTLRRSGRCPEDLVERLGEANVLRNRAVHNKPARFLLTTEADSLQVLTTLVALIEWSAELLGRGESSSAAAGGQPLRVFLSVGGPHRLDQSQFLQQLRAELRGANVELVSLSSNEYSAEKPFDQLRSVLQSCRGVLVVGMDRLHAYALFERERSERQKLIPDAYISTAWNQIEGSMASALGLPIMVLRERRLHREGIFEAENHNHKIREFGLEQESRALSRELRDYLVGWIRTVRMSSAKGASGSD